MINFEHMPVMPREVIDGLNIKPNGVYVDCTLGGGGHSGLICEHLEVGKLIGIDRDESAVFAASGRINSPCFQAIHGNFHDFCDIMDKLGISRGMVDGILMDLGVSSHQIDTPERGFSFRADGPLDMRMDKSTALTAEEIVNSYDEKELAQIFFEFGEERHSRRIARAIVEERKTSRIEGTLRLAEIIELACPRPRWGKSSRREFSSQPHPAMRSFMALRIAVNDELLPLGAVLCKAAGFLSTGGRIAVISFHSLEDRIVKTTFAKLSNPCECPRDIPYCVCGKKPSLRVVTRKPVLPSQEELVENRRAHSAKLRISEAILCP